MALLQKTRGFLGRYKRIVPVTKILKPVFTVLFYAMCLCFALFAIIALIVLIINVKVEEMLLPPHMSAIKDAAGQIVSYCLKLGNGISITAPAADITLGHIKLVIYAELATWALTFACAAPVFRMMSKLFANVASGSVLNEANARYINYTGLIIAAGYVLHSIVSNAMNYLQLRKFAAGTDIGYSFDIQWFGIIMGVFIVIIGTIYGYACALSAKDAELVCSEGESAIVASGEEDGQDEENDD